MYTSYMAVAPVQWETTIDRYKHVAIQAVVTKNFSIVNTVIAQSFTNDPDDHTRALFAITGSEDVTTTINNINVETAQASGDAMDTYNAAIEEKKNTGCTNEDWRVVLDDLEAKVIEGVKTKIQEATTKVKTFIATLPEAARPAAVNTFVTGSNWALKAFETLYSGISAIGHSIADFLKGVYDSVVQVCNSVMASVNSAVNAILGWFPLSSAPQPVRGPTPSARSFVGKLNWPAAASVATVTMGLGYVVKHLADHKIRIVRQTLIKENDGKETATETIIEFPKDGLSAPKPDEPLTELSRIWLEAVDQLGRDGHYIPA